MAVKPWATRYCHGIRSIPRSVLEIPNISLARVSASSGVIVSSLGRSWPVLASSGQFGIYETERAGASVLFSKKNSLWGKGLRAFERVFVAGVMVWPFLVLARRWLPSLAPRLALHGLHAGTRLSRSSLPPATCGTRWSASVAAFVWHQWQVGLSASSCLRLRLYVGSFVVCSLGI